jgi:lysophospholipase L1-like esterase
MLGINDMFAISRTDAISNTLNTSIQVFKNAEKLISAIKQELPNVKIIISSITSPNQREEAFIENYGNSIYKEKRYRDMQQEFIGLQEKHFSNREDENIYYFSTYHMIDNFNGYPSTNYLHPNTSGYEQIANAFYNELMWIFKIN